MTVNKTNPLLNNSKLLCFPEFGICPSCNTNVESRNIIEISKSPKDGRITTTYLGDSRISKTSICDSSSTTKIGSKQDAEFSRCSSPSDTVGSLRRILQNSLQPDAKSSKLNAVLDELYNVWSIDPGSKILIFSQFLGFFDILEMHFKNHRIHYGRLDGKLSIKERVAVLEKFKKYNGTNTAATHNPTESMECLKADADSRPIAQTRNDKDSSNVNIGSVLLISMKAGGVGLNLVAAKSVFIVDPWWNASIEDQCINRIHRIGQMADIVRVRKFVIRASVEERIVALQKKKKNIANGVLSESNQMHENSGNDNVDESLSLSRPTLDDFKLLFGK